MKEDLCVVLLAGGKSSRFWPLANKLTIPFLGQTLLEYQLNQLYRIRFKKIILVTTKELADRFSKPQNLKVVIQKGLGQSAALLSARELIKNQAILVLNADDLVSDTLFAQIVKAATKNINLLVGFRTSRYFPGGYLVCEGDRVVEIVEKPGVGKQPSDWVRLCCDYFYNSNRLISALENISAADPDSHYEQAINQLIKDREWFELVKYDQVWIPVKFPWDSLRVMDYLLKQIKTTQIDQTAKIHQTVSIVGHVVVGKNTQIQEYTKIVGPTYIGSGVMIGNQVLVRNSHIGDNSVVGFGSELTRSFVASDVWIHTNYIGDSVIDHQVAFGARATLANLRFDEAVIYSQVKGKPVSTNMKKLGAIIGEQSRIGISAKLMPGVKVGKRSLVGPGVILQQDLADNQRVLAHQRLEVKANRLNILANRTDFRLQLD